jgi:hypothetical protein
MPCTAGLRHPTVLATAGRLYGALVGRKWQGAQNTLND